jgi:tape measure domain-containing protein
MAGEKLGEAILVLSTDTKALIDGIRKSKEHTVDLDSLFKKVGESAERVGKKLSTSLTLPILALGAASVKAAADMEMQEAAFTTMLGSAERAKTMLAELTTMAAKTPFQLMDLTAAGKTMMAFGIAAESVLPNLQMLGDIAQGNSDKLGSLTLAFSQIQSTGRLMGQDLLQLINAGFNPLQIIAEKTGETMAELKDRMANGAISAQEVADAFKTATSEGGRFYNGMELASQTFSGKWSTLKDGIVALGRSFGEVLLPALKKAVDGLTKFTEKFSGLDEEQKKVIIAVLALTAAIGPLLLAVGKAMKLFSAMKLLLLANPWMLAVAGVIALGAAIFALTKNFRQEEKIRDSLLKKQSQGIQLTEEERMTLAEIELARLRTNKALAQENLLKAQSAGMAANVIAALQKNVENIQAEISVKTLEIRSLGEEIKARKLASVAIVEETGSADDLTDATENLTAETDGLSETLETVSKLAFDLSEMRPFDGFDDSAKYALASVEKLGKELEKNGGYSGEGGKGKLLASGIEAQGLSGGGADNDKSTGIMSTLSGIFGSLGDTFGSLGTKIVSILGALDSVQAVIDPLTTILTQMFETLGPAITEVLLPIVGILASLGTSLAEGLLPIIEALAPVIDALAQAFVWLYNNIILPVGNALLYGIGIVINGLIWMVNLFLAKAKKIAYIALDTLALAEITYDALDTAGTDYLATVAETESTSGGADYTQVRPIENNFYIEGNNIVGANGLREFVILLDEEWKQANSLGLV